MRYLRQSTGVAIQIGPFIVNTDGYTHTSTLTILYGTIWLIKADNTVGAKTETTDPVYLSQSQGMYSVVLNAADTNQLGHFRISVNGANLGTLPVWEDFTILTAEAYDQMFLNTNAYAGAIWIDTVNGATGTVLGVNGTPTNPCKTFASARTIAQANGFNTFNIRGGSNIITGDDFPSGRFIGMDAGSRLNLQNKDFSNAYFEGLILYGVHGGSGRIQTVKCRLGDTGQTLNNLTISAMNCIIGGDLTLEENEDHYFAHCVSGVAGTGTPSIIFGGTGATNVSFRNYSGGLEVKSMSANHTMSYEAVGQLVLDSSCIGGAISRRGAHNLVDNSGGAVTLTELAAVDRKGIVDGLKASTGWTVGGTWNFAKIINILAAWMAGPAHDKPGGPTGTVERLDPEDQTTPVIDEALVQDPPSKTTTVRI